MLFTYHFHKSYG